MSVGFSSKLPCPKQECAVGEHSLARMHCFQRFQRLVTDSVDQWCRHSNVTEVGTDRAGKPGTTEPTRREMPGTSSCRLAGSITTSKIGEGNVTWQTLLQGAVNMSSQSFAELHTVIHDIVFFYNKSSQNMCQGD